jgi:hypothetical protein
LLPPMVTLVLLGPLLGTKELMTGAGAATLTVQ